MPAFRTVPKSPQAFQFLLVGPENPPALADVQPLGAIYLRDGDAVKEYIFVAQGQAGDGPLRFCEGALLAGVDGLYRGAEFL